MKNIDEQYQALRKVYFLGEPTNHQKTIEKYGYLPVPFDVAREKLSDHDVFAILEQILTQRGIVNDGHINQAQQATSLRDSWLHQEQLKIESLCLSGLCQQNQNLQFRDYLIKIITTPKSQSDYPTTAFYLLPFYRRDPAFSSVYCPISVEVEPRLCDEKIQHTLGWNEEQQLQIFLHLCRLSGHPILIDLLPQAGRFSKTVFAHPSCFLWNDLQRLANSLSSATFEITSKLGLYGFAEMMMEDTFGVAFKNPENIQHAVLNALRSIYHERRTQILHSQKFVEGGDKGVSHANLRNLLIKDLRNLNINEIAAKYNFSEEVDKEEFDILYNQWMQIDFALDKERVRVSTEQLTGNSQINILNRVYSLIKSVLGKTITSETEISDEEHQLLIKTFIKKDLWPISGGCWNSSGYPIFRKMSLDAYPISDHYNYAGNLVSAFAGDMDIVSPWHFASPYKANDDDNLNNDVIQSYITYCHNIYQRFQPNGFRIDHVDHCVDYPVSVNEKGNSISYRAPLIVFRELANRIRQQDPQFVLLAEYMGWGDDSNPHLYKDYSENNIEAAISLDIVGEYRHNVKVMLEETNQRLIEFNQNFDKQRFTLTHVFDNHDRSHPDIVRALSEFTEERALLKWVKCLFLPGGSQASRPTIYLDGNQTHTPNRHFANIFLKYDTLVRSNNIPFFLQFMALYRYAIKNEIMRFGKSELLSYEPAAEGSNNAISVWKVSHDTGFFIIAANEHIDDNTQATPESKDVTIDFSQEWTTIEELIIPQMKSLPQNWLDIPEINMISIADSENVILDSTKLTFRNLSRNRFYICMCTR